MAEPHVHLFRIKEAFRYGWQKTRENLGPLLLIGAVGFFLGAVNEVLTRPNSQGVSPAPLLGLIVQVLQAGVTMAFIRTALTIHDGKPVDFSNLGTLFAGFWRYFFTSIVYGLIVAGGLILLIVPGVYWAVRYGFAPFLSVDQRLHAVDALRASGRLTEGVKGDVLLFGLAAIGLNLLGAIALGLGLFLTVPMSFLAAAFVLRRLQARVPVQPPTQIVGPLTQAPA